MIAAVVIISVIIALLVFVMIVSLKQQGWLLEEMVSGGHTLVMFTLCHDR